MRTPPVATATALLVVLAGCSGPGGDASPDPATTTAVAGSPTPTPVAPTMAPSTAATTSSTPLTPGEQGFPDVVAVEASPTNGTWRISATISSPYDSPDRYADAFRVLDPDGAVLGVRELTHDHAGEQPFTRSLDGVDVPDGVTSITVQGRDQANGWGGATITVRLPG